MFPLTWVPFWYRFFVPRPLVLSLGRRDASTKPASSQLLRRLVMASSTRLASARRCEAPVGFRWITPQHPTKEGSPYINPPEIKNSEEILKPQKKKPAQRMRALPFNWPPPPDVDGSREAGPWARNVSSGRFPVGELARLRADGFLGPK